MFPGKMKMKRVKWKAKYEHEFIHNLKLLQQGFLKAKIKKWIDVNLFLLMKFTINRYLSSARPDR